MFEKDNTLVWFVFQGYTFEVQRAFGLLKTHSNSIEEQLAQEAREFRDYLEEQAGNLTSDQKEELFEWHGESLSIVASELPGIHRNAMLVSSYSIFEHYLNEYCRLFEGVGGIKLHLREVAGQGVERARLYLSKVIGVQFPPDEEQWNTIKMFSLIRNILVHRNGELDEKGDKRIIEYAKASEYLAVGREDSIRIGRGTIEYLAELFESFFLQLDQSLRAKFKELVASNRS